MHVQSCVLCTERHAGVLSSLGLVDHDSYPCWEWFANRKSSALSALKGAGVSCNAQPVNKSIKEGNRFAEVKVVAGHDPGLQSTAIARAISRAGW